MSSLKLLVEHSTHVEKLTEEVGGVKQMFIEGIFAQAEVVNGNRRRYPKAVLEPAIDKYIREYVMRNKAIGELDHPEYPMPKSKNAAIRIVEMKWDGDNVYGKALVLNTPVGQIARGLLEGGYAYGVSTRALGSVKESTDGVKYVQPGLMVTAVDMVDNPSGPDCNVNPLLESINWRLDESKGIWVPEAGEKEGSGLNEELLQEKIKEFLKGIKA